MSVLDDLKEAVISGNLEQTISGVEKATAAGIAPADIIETSLIAGMEVVGDRFKKQEIYVPEMMIAARAMKAALNKLRPLMVGSEVKSRATVVIGTVKGDLHDIGKNLVSTMMEGAGFTVIDLGIDIAPERFAEAVEDHHPHVLAMSALLTTTMPMMKETVSELEKRGRRGNVKVLVGGAPVSEAFAAGIGADGYADNAAEAVDKVKSLVGRIGPR